MTPLRIGFCTSKFWPQPGNRSGWNQDFCRQLSDTIDLTVFTSRWTNDNPARFEWHGTTVHRIFENSWAPFGANIMPSLSILSVSRHLKKNLQKHVGEFDAMLVNDTPARTLAALQVIKRFDLPLLIRIQDDWSQKPGWRKILMQLQRAVGTMGPKLRFATSCRSLMDQAGDLLSIEWIEDGIRLENDEWSLHSPAECRNVFRQTHPVLEIDDDAPLLLYVGGLERNTSLHLLIRTFYHLKNIYPQARFWICGQGRGEDEIWQTIVHHELNLEVVMAGSFDVLNDLIRAANYLWLPPLVPSKETMHRRTIQLAMREGLPILCCHSNFAEWVRDRETGRTYPECEPEQLARVIDSILSDTSPLESIRESARSLVVEKGDFRQTGDRYLQVLEQLVRSG